MNRQALWQELRQDAWYGVRTLRRAPLFTIIAILTLGLGIGASTSIFSVVYAVLLRALPYRQAERVVVIANSYRQGGSQSHTAIAPPEFADIVDQNRVFDQVAAVTTATANLVGDCGGAACEPERIAGYSVSTNLFDLLGTRAALGRGFVTADGDAGAEAVVVLSHALWTRRFGGDTAMIGRTLNINGALRTVVGVMPATVRFPDVPIGFLREPGELWLPRDASGDRGIGRGNQYLVVVARLRPGMPLDAARRDLEAISAAFRQAFPSRYDKQDLRWGLHANALRDEMVGDVRRPLLIVLGAVLLLLVIACANVAHLSLARGAARRGEFAIRTALGAGRGRLVRQLVTESLLLGTGAAVAGILLAVLSTGGLARLDHAMIPWLATAEVSPAVLGFAIGMAMASALLVGILPALRQSQARVHDLIRIGGRGEAGSSRRQGRGLLVVAEVALAVVILVGAGLFTRSFTALQRFDPGFDPGPALTFSVTLPRARYDNGAKLVQFHAALQDRLASLPGVRAVTGADPLPLGGTGWSGSFDVEGVTVAPGQQEPHAELGVALPGFVGTLGMRLLLGRDFAPTDIATAPLVAIVDDRLAERYWPGEDPLGKRVDAGAGGWSTVVGVVRHVYKRGPRDDGEPQVYLPFAQRRQAPLSYVLRVDGDPLALAGAVRREVAAVDPELPISRVSTMASLQSSALAGDRFNALMLAIFAVTALLLAAIGLYGVMAYLVTLRQGEIGIRLALGGRPADVLRMVMGEGILMAGIGIAIGTAASLALGRLVAGLLYDVAPTDPITYAGIIGTLAVVALIASAVPARRATRADPASILRR